VIVVYASYATERRDEYIAWVNDRLGTIHALDGCVLYEAFAHERTDDRVVMVEVWDTQQAFDAWAVHPLHDELVRSGEADWGLHDYTVHIWADARGHRLLATESLVRR
jgi:quinol monooxygenase YgiN